MEKLEANPTLDISAESMRHADVIARVAQVSKNLKGTAKKQLNHAALYIKIAITTLAIRAQQLESGAEAAREIESLRRQVNALKADNLRMT